MGGELQGASFPARAQSSVVSDDLYSCDGNAGGLGGVDSAEAVLGSDCPVFGSNRQYFDEKRQPSFRKRPFHLLIGDMMLFTCPEMTTFSNDTGRDIFKDGLGAVREHGGGTAGCFFPGEGPVFRRE